MFYLVWNAWNGHHKNVSQYEQEYKFKYRTVWVSFSEKNEKKPL